MRRVWSINIRNLLVSTPSKSKPSESTVELNSWYHRVGQNESQSSVEGERNGNDEDAITPDVSQGVQKAEAIALVWNKKSAYGTYAWIFICMFMLGLHVPISAQANGYASHYNEHESSEKTRMTLEIMQKVLGTVLKLPAARLLNVWGRAEGFLVFVGIYLIGIIILAACSNATVWAVGYSFYVVGQSVLWFILFVFITDITEVQHRALAMAFIQSPLLCTTFTGPMVNESLTINHWRWAYWAFAIIMPVVLCPLAGIFRYYQWVAEVRGVYKRPAPSGRSPAQSIIYHMQKFDLVGNIILKAAFVLFLLPLTMDTYGEIMYDSPMFIVPLAVGGFLLGLYGLWQRYGARDELLNTGALKPAIIGCFALAFIQQISFYCWDMYNFEASIAYYKLSLKSSSYVMQIYNLGSRVGGMLFGFAVFFTRRFKPICLYIGLPLMILGLGLMINVRGTGGSSDVGYRVGYQILVGLAAGTVVVGSQLAVTVFVERDSIPIMLFLLQMCNGLGGGIGLIVSRAIYKSTFPSALGDALPAGNKTISESLYQGGYTVQNSFPAGSEIRGAIDMAWEVYLQRAYIIATAVLAAGIPAVAVWTNVYLNQKQNKGVMI